MGFRLLAVALVLALVGGVLTWRLAEIQVSGPERFVQIGEQQRFRTLQLAASRGDVVDRNGNTLATSLPRTSFFVDPLYVEDPIGAAARLAPILGKDEGDLRELLASDSRFGWLARQTDDATAAEILALDIAGVFTTEEPTRFHPSGPALARSVIGNVDIDNLGLSGAELIYNELLEGQAGERRIEIGVNGDWIPGGPGDHTPAVPGADVVLTLDRSLQFEVERILRDQIVNMGAKGGVVVVAEPHSGEVLAMASFDRAEDGELVSTSLNMATSWAFEPGSVMKAITFSALLDAGVATPESRRTVTDTYELYDAVFTDSTPHATTDWSVTDIVTVSSNVGTVHWAEELGGARLDGYLDKFGFGEPAGLGFPGETGGILLEPDQWGGVGTATTALGQGISVTPAQMISAYNAIANGGSYVPLTLLREVVHGDGTREVPRPDAPERVISPTTAAQVRQMLENAVAVGTGVNAQVPGYRVAGKTGTARKALDGALGYEDGAGNFRYVATFAGFLPADNPELTILVTIDQPTATIYASHAAAPPFAEIATFAVRHLRIAPPASAPATAHAVHVPERLAPRVTGEVAAIASDPAPNTAPNPAPNPAPETAPNPAAPQPQAGTSQAEDAVLDELVTGAPADGQGNVPQSIDGSGE